MVSGDSDGFGFVIEFLCGTEWHSGHGFRLVLDLLAGLIGSDVFGGGHFDLFGSQRRKQTYSRRLFDRLERCEPNCLAPGQNSILCQIASDLKRFKCVGFHDVALQLNCVANNYHP